MNPFAAYYAINTKLHAKKRVLFSDEDWLKMLEFKKINQFIDFIKKQEGFGELVMQYKKQDIHRSDLEIILDRYVVSQVEQMLHYFSGDYKNFFKTLLMEYEIVDLQLLLRSIARNEPMKEIEENFIHSTKYGLTCYSKLLNCNNVIQFVENLRGSEYYDALKTLTQEDIIKREFHMEMRLYILYYKTLMKRAEKLSQKDHKIAVEMIGSKIDFANVQWIYRATKYYDISPEEILIYSLPGGTKVSYRKLKTLCYTKSIEEMKQLANKYLGRELFDHEGDVFLERTMDRYLYQYAKKLEVDKPNVATVLAYICMLTTEVQDLVALTEGIRYELPENELKQYLVHTI